MGPRGRGLAAFILFQLASVLIFGLPVIGHLTGRFVGTGDSDQMLYVWALRWWPYAILHGQNPFVADVLWAPGGVNLAWITAIPGPSIVMTPITLTLGPVASLNLLMLAAPALSGWSAYLLCNRITKAFLPSLLAGYVFGFSTYMAGQMVGHINLVLIFPIPLCIYLVFRRIQGSIGPVAFVVLLALALVAIFSISTEQAATTAMFGGIAYVGLMVLGPADMRKRLLAAGALVVMACAIAGVLVSPYLYYALKNPPTFSRNVQGSSNDLLALVVPSRHALIGGSSFGSVSRRFSLTWVGDGAYVSLPLLFALGHFAATQWRKRATWLLLALLAVIGVLSLGPVLQIEGRRSISLPLKLLQNVPVIRYMLPDRFSLFAWLAIAVILALWLAAPSRLSWARRAVVVLGAVMILPNVTAMEHGSLQLPAFFAADTYRNYLSPNEIVLPIPFGQRPGGAQEMIWLAETDMYFRVAGGHVGWVPRVDQVPVTRSLISNQPGSIDPGDLQVFLVTHHVGAIVVGGAYASQWAGLLETTLRTQPVEVGGVQLYLVRDGVGVPVPGPGPSSGIP